MTPSHEQFEVLCALAGSEELSERGDGCNSPACAGLPRLQNSNP